MRKFSTDLNSQPPMETLLLLANWGAGCVEKVVAINKTRVAMLQALSNKITHDEETVFPQDDISGGTESVPIPWVNETGDGEVLHAEFTYISRAIESDTVGVRWFHCRQHNRDDSEPMLRSWADRVVTTNSRNGTSCTNAVEGEYLRTNQRLGRKYWVECNYLCPCAESKHVVPAASGRLDVDSCGNRSLSRGLRHRLEVFRTPIGEWGLRTARYQSIPKGEILFCEAGIYRREEERNELEKFHDSSGVDRPRRLNLFQVRGNCRRRGPFLLDSSLYRSIAGFVTYKGAGNLEQLEVLGNHLDTELPLIAFRTVENIGPLTELCLNNYTSLSL